MANNDDLGFVADDDLGFVEETPIEKPKGLTNRLASQASVLVPESVKNVKIDAPDKSLASVADEYLLDPAIGVAKGVTMGAADELAGLIGAGTEKLQNAFMEDPAEKRLKELGITDTSKAKSFLDIYRQDQQRAQQELNKREERSPWLDIAGQVAGGVTTGGVLDKLGLFGKANTAAPKLMDVLKNEGKLKAGLEILKRGGTGALKMAPSIAIESALSSKTGGLLTPEERENLALDTAGGLTFGLAAGTALGSAADAAKLGQQATKEAISGVVQENPYLRQIAKNFELRKQGVNLAKESEQLAGAKSTFKLEEDPAKDVLSQLDKARKDIGNELGRTLDTASATGQIIDVSKEAKDLGNTLQYLDQNYPFLSKNVRAKTGFGTIIDKFQKSGYNLTPRETKTLLDDIDVFVNKFRSSSNITAEEAAVADELSAVSQQLKERLKNEVSGFAEQNKRFARFNELVPEQLLSGTTPSDLSNKMYKDFNDVEAKQYEKLMNLIQSTTKEGNTSDKAKRSFSQFKEGLDKFNAEELAAGRTPALDTENIQKQILGASDIAAIRQGLTQIDPTAGITSRAVGTLTGSQSGKAAGLRASGAAGATAKWLAERQSKSPSVNLTKQFVSAPAEILQGAANELKSYPSLKNYGDMLEQAVQNNNIQRRNQAIFVIMQNPEARAVFGADK